MTASVRQSVKIGSKGNTYKRERRRNKKNRNFCGGKAVFRGQNCVQDWGMGKRPKGVLGRNYLPKTKVGEKKRGGGRADAGGLLVNGMHALQGTRKKLWERGEITQQITGTASSKIYSETRSETNNTERRDEKRDRGGDGGAAVSDGGGKKLVVVFSRKSLFWRRGKKEKEGDKPPPLVLMK